MFDAYEARATDADGVRNLFAWCEGYARLTTTLKGYAAYVWTVKYRLDNGLLESDHSADDLSIRSSRKYHRIPEAVFANRHLETD